MCVSAKHVFRAIVTAISGRTWPAIPDEADLGFRLIETDFGLNPESSTMIREPSCHNECLFDDD